MTVRLLMKYLANKLKLDSESEVSFLGPVLNIIVQFNSLCSS